jgi:hypothetical protein
MVAKSVAFRLLATVLLFALSLAGLDVVDSARRVVVVEGYLRFAVLATAALVTVVRKIRARRSR